MIISLEQILFERLHCELWQGGKEKFYPPEKRKSFWQVIIPGTYHSEGAAKLVQLYFKALEKELAAELSQHSITYWLYVYRKLAPKSIGFQKDAVTIYWTRAIFEAAVQKYGRFDECGGIAVSTDVDERKILNGILFDKSIPQELRDKGRRNLKESERTILLNFGLDELRQIYMIEGLAHEIWRTVAMMRIIGKGSPIIVEPDSEVIVRDGRSAGLDKLVSIFDERGSRYGVEVSATGTVFGSNVKDVSEGGVFLIPEYNVRAIPGKRFEKLLSNLNLEVGPDFNFNFVWPPFELKNFYQSHVAFSDGFEDKHGLPLEEFIAILGTLLLRVACSWTGNKDRLLGLWQRGYEQISSKDFIIGEIRKYISEIVKELRLTVEVDKIDVGRVVSFLELTDEKRNNIDLRTHGPHYVFLPFGRGRFCVDYAWIRRSLYNLFYGVELDVQNFKGHILETVVREEESPLPSKKCKGYDGSSKQIDASYGVGDTLVIGECKTKSKSFGFFRGDATAINHRNEFIRKVLAEVDEKARWLVGHPKGTNYDIQEFARIIPIVITPFVEYIPSLEDWYWLEDGLPRVLTPKELKEKLSDGTIARVSRITSNGFMIVK